MKVAGLSILATLVVAGCLPKLEPPPKAAEKPLPVEAEEQGVFDTPMYVVGSDRFLGREQLPWMRALLANKL